jgi:hypothetical protein
MEVNKPSQRSRDRTERPDTKLQPTIAHHEKTLASREAIHT